mgnify:CR=1 FL=1
MPFNIIKLNSSSEYLIDQTSTQYLNNELYEKNKVLNIKERGFDDIEKNQKYIRLLNHLKILFERYSITCTN